MTARFCEACSGLRKELQQLRDAFQDHLDEHADIEQSGGVVVRNTLREACPGFVPDPPIWIGATDASGKRYLRRLTEAERAKYTPGGDDEQ